MTLDHDAVVQHAIPLQPNSGLPEFGTLSAIALASFWSFGKMPKTIVR